MQLYEDTFGEGERESEPAIIENLVTETADREGGHLVIVAEEHPDSCVGGVIFSYLPSIDCGYTSYLVVDPAMRRLGIGSGLLDEMKTCLTTEATRHGQRRVLGAFTELEREDPKRPETFLRFRFWQRNGVLPLAVDWRYPRLHGGQPPLAMYLAFGSYTDGQQWWYPQQLELVANTIFEATYSYLPSYRMTLEAVVANLRSLPQNQPVRYLQIEDARR